MSNLLKNLLFALGLVLLLLLGYATFMQEDDDPLLQSSTNTVVSSQAALESERFLTRTKVLDSIEIDKELFSNPSFVSLVDFRKELVPENTGRQNPFAALE